MVGKLRSFNVERVNSIMDTRLVTERLELVPEVKQIEKLEKQLSQRL